VPFLEYGTAAGADIACGRHEPGRRAHGRYLGFHTKVSALETRFGSPAPAAVSAPAARRTPAWYGPAKRAIDITVAAWASSPRCRSRWLPWPGSSWSPARGRSTVRSASGSRPDLQDVQAAEHGHRRPRAASRKCATQRGRRPRLQAPPRPRLHPLGALLRRTASDELPNFVNVLLGDMAIVGPRPRSRGSGPLRQRAKRRLTVKPGVTCLWQSRPL